VRLLTGKQLHSVGFDRLAAPASLVIAMAQTADGKVWLGTEHRGLFYLQEDSVLSTSNGRADTKINCILPLSRFRTVGGNRQGRDALE